MSMFVKVFLVALFIGVINSLPVDDPQEEFNPTDIGEEPQASDIGSVDVAELTRSKRGNHYGVWCALSEIIRIAWKILKCSNVLCLSFSGGYGGGYGKIIYKVLMVSKNTSN